MDLIRVVVLDGDFVSRWCSRVMISTKWDREDWMNYLHFPPLFCLKAQSMRFDSESRANMSHDHAPLSNLANYACRYSAADIRLPFHHDLFLLLPFLFSFNFCLHIFVSDQEWWVQEHHLLAQKMSVPFLNAFHLTIKLRFAKLAFWTCHLTNGNKKMSKHFLFEDVILY